MKPLICAILTLLVSHAALAAQPSSNFDQDEAVKGSNAFAVDLYAQLRAQPGNLFFSPESISTAFAMAYAGAHGQTATEMAAVFHFTLPPDRLHSALGALLAGMNATHQDYELHAADALWAQKGDSFLPSYLKLVRTDYGAGFHPIDFKTAPEAARATINQWVEQQTANNIQNLLGPGAVTPATKLVLTNAIYFKGMWSDPFPVSYTRNEEFHLSASQTVQAPLMNRTGEYDYFDGGTFQALELPYTGGELSMIVLLPNDMAGLPALEKSLTAAAVSDWIGKLQPMDKVVVTLPRFTMTQEFELNGVLSAMGMPQAFSDAADFSGMTGGRDLFISAAVHKAYISVDEKGTVAAAATGIGFETAMEREQPPPITFRADHPFLFLIRDNQSGSILFMGRVVHPTK